MTLSAREQLAKLNEKKSALEAKIRMEEEKRLAALGSVVANLLQKDSDFRASVLPKIAAASSPRVKFLLNELLIDPGDQNGQP